MLINPFVPNAPFFYPLKTSENLMVFCFQGVGKDGLGTNELNSFVDHSKRICDNSLTITKFVTLYYTSSFQKINKTKTKQN